MRWHWRDAVERVIDRLWYGPKGWLYVLLFVPLGLFTPLSRLAALRRRRARPAPAPLPLIGVGNLVVGGSGKTQVVLELARRALEGGKPSALLTRGYGVRLVSPTRVSVGTPSTLAGDEACLLARRQPRALVLAGPDRLDSARLAQQLGARLAILDDGLQQRRVAVDRKVWVLGAESPLGNARLLPLGPLRDSPRVIAPQDLVWLHGEGAPPAGLQVHVRSRAHPIGLVSAFDLGSAPRPVVGVRVAAFCGIARPHRFLASLHELGAVVVRSWALGDHRSFEAAELHRAVRLAQNAGATALICTEKDAVRLPPVSTPLPILALRVELQILDGEDRITGLLEL